MSTSNTMRTSSIRMKSSILRPPYLFYDDILFRPNDFEGWIHQAVYIVLFICINSELERETREKLHALLTPDISTKPFQEVLKMRVDICMDFFCKLCGLQSPIQGV